MEHAQKESLVKKCMFKLPEMKLNGCGECDGLNQDCKNYREWYFMPQPDKSHQPVIVYRDDHRLQLTER